MSKAESISYKANGKLLLTGEYLVMDGATALALPLSANQTLTAQPTNDAVIEWSAYDSNGLWFEATYQVENFDILTSNDQNKAASLQNILRAAAALNPHHQTTGSKITTLLNFNRLFGFGSSSTLIALIARYFDVDKYRLHKIVSGGSGYDIACAEINHPILFTKSSENELTIRPVDFNPPFIENLFLIYLGQKQDTNAEISQYKSHKIENLSSRLNDITDITFKLIKANELTTFASLIEQHEQIMSSVLQRKSIKEIKFSDFNGFVKSLGAWGGDFILAGSSLGEAYVFEYFGLNGFNTIYRYRDLVLNNTISSNHDTVIRF